jgi:hypothetical protein
MGNLAVQHNQFKNVIQKFIKKYLGKVTINHQKDAMKMENSDIRELNMKRQQLKFSSKTGNSPKNIQFLAINIGESRHFSRNQSSQIVTCHQLSHPSLQLIL